MLTLKKIDLIGQALIFCFGILLLFTGKDKWGLMSLFFCLPIGCWQILSMLIHFRLEKKVVMAKGRKGYIICVVVFFITLFTSIILFEIKKVSDIPITTWYFFLASTSLAIWYLYISFRELIIWQHRQFIQLR